MNNNTATPAPETETFQPIELEDDLTVLHSKLSFLYGVASSFVMSGGELKINPEGVYGLDLILCEMCRDVEGMKEKIFASITAKRKGA